MSMRAAIRLLTICTAGVAMLATAVPAANAGYPFKCPKNTVLVLEHEDPTATPSPHVGPTAIQDAIEEAHGLTDADMDPENPVPSSSGGDTVIVCDGTYMENVSVPLADGGGTNSDITIRSFDDGSNPTIVGTSTTDPVFDINAPGVLLGGTHLGFEITGVSPIGIRVTDPTSRPDLDEDDDQELGECPDDPPIGVDADCRDEERSPFVTSNVAVIGNEIRNLGDGTSDVTGIAVSNTNNTLVFRNKVDRVKTGAGNIAYGIRYSGTNYNNEVISNAVTELSQTGPSCANPSLTNPTEGAVAIAIQQEALDALVHQNLIDKIQSSCSAIGVHSNAWGGLENTRNGQQAPIVTDILDNRIKKVQSTSTGSNPAAGVALAPLNPPANPSDDNDDNEAPSSFRVLANDIDETAISVAVLMGMAPNSYIRENDLDKNQIGVLNASGFNVDATNNWWGCTEGPASGKGGCSTIMNVEPDPDPDDMVVNSTTSYTPWLKKHAAHAGAHAGEYAGH